MKAPKNHCIFHALRSTLRVWTLVAAVMTAGGMPTHAWAVGNCLSPPGDLNKSGSTNVTDAQCAVLANLWWLSGASQAQPACLGANHRFADLNCDHVLSVSDTTLLVTLALGDPLPSALDANADGCADACAADTDADGDPDYTDCARLDPASGTSAPEGCNGFDDDCDGAIDEGASTDCDDGDACTGVESCAYAPPLQPLVITEIMRFPVFASKPSGDWIELFNPGPATIDIRGWRIRDNSGDNHVIQPGGPRFVAPGSYFVVGGSAMPSLNGGAAVDYAWSAFTLALAADVIVLEDPYGNDVDVVAYSLTEFPNGIGQAMALRDVHLDNALGASWSNASSVYGAGDRGTPGAPNRDVSTESPCMAGIPLVCESPSPCFASTCNAVGGCTFEPAGGVPCDDGSPCTDDFCSQAGECQHAPNSATCSDANACTAGDLCAWGACQPGSPITCTDGNPCTLDACSPQAGCQFTPTPGAVSCYDGPAGTLGVGECTAGTRSCEGGALGPCLGAKIPTAEVCDGKDNDCNYGTDEGGVCCAPPGTVCGGPGACCTGLCNARCCTSSCPADGWACNGLHREFRDWQCNSAGGCTFAVTSTQLGGGACTVQGAQGPCAQGILQCSGGAMLCQATVQATPEVCDGVDNDCDGKADEFGACGNGLYYYAGMGGWNAETTCAALGGYISFFNAPGTSYTQNCYTRGYKLARSTSVSPTACQTLFGGIWEEAVFSGNVSACWWANSAPAGVPGASLVSVLASSSNSQAKSSPFPITTFDKEACQLAGGNPYKVGFDWYCEFYGFTIYQTPMPGVGFECENPIIDGGYSNQLQACFTGGYPIYIAAIPDIDDWDICEGLGGYWDNGDQICWHTP